MEEAEKTEETESGTSVTEKDGTELPAAEKEAEELSGTEQEAPDLSGEETELEVEIRMNTGALYDYLLRHVYTSLSGPLGTCLGLAGVAYYAYSRQIIYLILGILLIVYLPLTLWRRAATLMLTNPAFKEPLHYRFSESGYTVTQGGESGSVLWEQCTKAVSTGKSIIIYTGPKNASIFPRKQIEGGAELLIAVIARHMEPKRIKIRY
ncbi:MAG: YcxB family protein [Lachnospiraceae bacterium]|nr:YcxB family protein [Lachnospiraceae bacterium]